MYPLYAKCVELGIPIFVCAGVPWTAGSFCTAGSFADRRRVLDFPDLVFVTRHGCEPWEDLAVKLMLKWPNLYYSTSAFAPKYYPKAIIDYANTRGADKIIYAGYFPMGLSLERIFSELPNVPLKDEVWPKFLYGNAARILGLEELKALWRWRSPPSRSNSSTLSAGSLARHAPIDATRAAFDSIADGELPPWWPEFVEHGFHAVHLPGDVGGQGGSLVDMACVVEAAAAALLPGPLLSTVTASAVASLADASVNTAANRTG